MTEPAATPVPDTPAEAAAGIRQRLTGGSASAAVTFGQAALRTHYFDREVREALAEAYETAGRDEEARRLFPAPRRPARPQHTKMTPQHDPALIERIEASDTSAYSFPPVSLLENARHYTLSTPENFDLLPDHVRAHPEFEARDTRIDLPPSRVAAYEYGRMSGNGAFITKDFEFLNTNRVGHSGLSHICFAPGLGWHIDLDDVPEDLGEPVFLFQRHPMINYYHFIDNLFNTIQTLL